MHGETVGIVANNSAVKGGVLFTDSADKATPPLPSGSATPSHAAVILARFGGSRVA